MTPVDVAVDAATSRSMTDWVTQRLLVRSMMGGHRCQLQRNMTENNTMLNWRKITDVCNKVRSIGKEVFCGNSDRGNPGAGHETCCVG